jgi:phosphoribosyl 1,2-cyclic phosphate phosphodiesterase
VRITFLGTGTSRGIPVVGCDCSVCRSPDPRNQRLRCSLLIESGVTVVIDTSSDFRQQMLRANVKRLDAVLLTHHHVDHVLGLDDVFPFTVREEAELPVYAGRQTLAELKLTFRHLFSSNRYKGIARLSPREIEGRFRVGDLDFEPLEVLHGGLPVLGFRVGGLAYLTDVNHIPEACLAQLRDLRLLVLDGLRYRPHRTHYSIPEAVEVSRRIGPERTLLVHMSHEVDHAAAEAALPHSMGLAYDGLSLEI